MFRAFLNSEKSAGNDVSNSKQACIIVMDSLVKKSNRMSDQEVSEYLRNFLSANFKEAYPDEVQVFSVSIMPSKSPNVPQQENLTDCGLFLIKNVELFIKNYMEASRVSLSPVKIWLSS